jgi:DNA-binding transcriptional LysR family regulator
MSISDLRRSDLNLLVVFDVLLELRSATRAAEALHTTQPSISRSLARLREILGDPLLVNVKGRLEPTPRALALRPVLRDALAALDAILDPSAAHRSEESARLFNVVCTSPVELALTPALQPWLDSSLPGVMVRFSTAPSGIAIPEDQLDEGTADLAIGRFATHPSRFALAPLFGSRRVCVVRQDHPCAQEQLTLEQTVALEYLTISNMADRQNEVDLMLRDRGLRRRISLYVSHVGIVPFVLVKSDYAALIPLFAARMLAEQFPLRIVELPEGHHAHAYSMVWHRRWDASPAHQRIRERITEELGKLDEGAPGQGGAG